ncbi:MAG: hypothetical protein K9K67_14930 [Bacteriovoracaceae bacterium]|nr:hypothetical protein [Bacteriovoracaceae bacterium]
MVKALKKTDILDAEVVQEKSSNLRVVDSKDTETRDSLEKEFKLKSEFFEKNVNLPKTDLDNATEAITQVKVFKDSGIEIVNPRDLKKFINENKGIKQVVVEKISIDEATRISLLFEPRHHASEFVSLVEDTIEGIEQTPQSLEEKQDAKYFNLDELENLINQEFLGNSSKVKTEAKVNKPVVASEVVAEDKLLKFKWPKSKSELTEEVAPTTQQKEENKKTPPKMSLKLKSDSEKEEKKVNYEKHTFTRKKSRSGHGYYYRAKDHVELFKVGSSFLKDFRSGLKSFSFSSIGLKEEREKSVLGILSFFNYHEDVNICVVTPSLMDSYYSKIATKAHKKEARVFDEDLHYDFYTGDGFEIIEYSELKKIERKITAYNFEDFLDFLLGSFDIILWDLPELEILDSNKEVYFPIIRSLDNVSFIVGKNVSKISEINEMISYFKRYQISIKGLLFSDSSKDREDQK